MLIQVMYRNKSHDYLKDFQLSRYIDSGKIVKFRRSTGWVTVGLDPIRTKKSTAYIGPERRNV
jgi:hypothetical protein